MGATEGTRTPDRLITNQLLYQLSYGGAGPFGHTLALPFVTISSCFAYQMSAQSYNAPKNLNYKIMYIALSRKKIGLPGLYVIGSLLLRQASFPIIY